MKKYEIQEPAFHIHKKPFTNIEKLVIAALIGILALVAIAHPWAVAILVFGVGGGVVAKQMFDQFLG